MTRIIEHRNDGRAVFEVTRASKFWAATIAPIS